jgi:glycolate oxidase iron-sulfur subunit
LRLRLGLLEQREPGFKTLNLEPKTLNTNPGSTGIGYFTGCLARHLQPSVAAATNQLLAQCGFSAHTPAEQCCCGLASWSGGNRDQARELAQKNIQAFTGSIGPIITSCASCSSHLFTYPDLFDPQDPWHERALKFAERVQEFTAFFNTHLPGPESVDNQKMRIFYHDPCHLRFTEGGRQTPRLLLRSQGLQLAEPEDGPSCCGQGGLFHLGYPEISAVLFQNASDKALAAEPDCITTTCSGCLMQYQQGIARRHAQTRVVHLAVLLTEIIAPTSQENQLQ